MGAARGRLRRERQQMYKITYKKSLNSDVTLMRVHAPSVAARAQPGQFVILRVDQNGERIPLTIADYDPRSGDVTIIFQTVGETTYKLSLKNEGDDIQDFAGPLGNPTHTEGLSRVAIVAGGVGCAIALPVAKKLHAQGAQVHAIAGFRSKDLVILQDEFKANSSKFILMTDDGSAGEKGMVTDALKRLLDEGQTYDEVLTIGPLIMMKFVCGLTRGYGVRTVASMNPIMIDGTGMCGGCRLTVDGKTRFACVEGPEFDGHKIDFDEAIMRAGSYREFETKRRESCKLPGWRQTKA